MHLSPVTTIVPRVVDRQWNGEANGYQLRFPLQVQLLKIPVVTGFLPMDNGATSSASWFPLQDTCELNYRLGLTFDGNGQWRRISRTCCQGRWSCTMSTTQWFGGRLAMEPMEGATIPEKIYSKL